MNVLTIKDLQAKLNIRKTTIYKLIQQGKFPAGVSLSGKPGTGSVRWLESQVDAWLTAQFQTAQK